MFAPLIETVVLPLPFHEDCVSALPSPHVSLDAERRIRAMHFADGLFNAASCGGIELSGLHCGLGGMVLQNFRS